MENQIYLLLGFGVSNQSCAKILTKYDKKFCIWDDNESQRLKAKNIKLEIYNNQNITDIILSPGIKDHKFLDLVKKDHIHNEIDIFFSLSKHKTIKIACTGSFGKSTTVSLIAHILNNNSMPARAVGNLGITMDNLKENEIPIIELSSFQLEIVKSKFDIGVILNIKEHHLDQYRSYQEYYDAKCNLGRLSLYLLLGDDIHCSHNNCNTISLTNKKANYALINKVIYENGLKTCTSPNDNNALLSAYSVCRKLNIDSQNIIKAFNTFKPLKHRQEIINNNPIIINDSKSTSLECATFILQKHRNIFWICGGKSSHISQNSINKIPLERIKQAFIVGENSQILSSVLSEKNVKHNIYDNLESSIKEIKYKYKDETIIFSPGFQSFDQYKNFEERGVHFTKLIKKYF